MRWPSSRVADRPEIHRTPKHGGSWLNVAEVELAVPARRCLSRRIADRPTLAAKVGTWERDRNAVGSGVDWWLTTTDARIKLKRLYPVLVC